MEKLKMDGVRSQVIDLIKGEVKERGGQVHLFVTGDRFFESSPVPVPHGSEMCDVTVNITVDDELGILYQVDEEEDESFGFEELDLLTLTFILSRL